ncbi:MAG: NTP/NDP exchange transporter [Candidatus Babeliales bacterium]
MLSSLIHYFYPDLKPNEVKKFGILALIFSLIIGGYWLIRLLKNTLFIKVCFPEDLGCIPNQGLLLQPTAKLISPLVVFALVLVYSKLVDMYKKHVLFYIIASVYVLLFGSFTVMLFLRNMYGNAFLGKTLLGAFGWVSYFTIESFGSLIVALFWSFTNSITASDSAKRGYPLIIACAQVGAIIGAGLMIFSHTFGLPQLLAVVTLTTAAIIPAVYYFMKEVPASDQVGDPKSAKTEGKSEGSAGFLEGIRLLFTKPYLMGILLVSTIYEVMNQVLEYQMQYQVNSSSTFAGELGFAQFQGYYGVATNTLSFLMALLGTSYLIKKYGLRFGLLFFPACLVAALASLLAFYYFGNPTAGALLAATFVAMMIAKGLGYAVNNPVKEMMYIPTSKDAKFKTKGFIDVFGSRMAKMGGGQINNMFKTSFNDLIVYGTLFSFGLSAVWILAAVYVGNKNAQLIKDNQIVE